MITALLLAVLLFLSAVASHLAILGVGHRLLDRRRDTLAKLAVSLLVLASHFLVAILFAAGFWLGAQWAWEVSTRRLPWTGWTTSISRSST
ncbi:hypothetical protein [Erythrobacter sp. JK5]|uniref:hypothetical protein n=1 Tax=Erythrobacter sp. JK5 TaxID=2829500 RepID=UPI002013775E|nr:hypothetical protein [Erythrobacter sp. JK5]